MSLSLPTLFEKLGKITFSKRWLVFFAFLILILVSMYGATMITMYSGMDTYISKDSKMYQDLDLYTRSFSSESVVIMIEGADATDPALLNASLRLTRMMINVTGVEAVTSPAGIVAQINGQTTGRYEIPATQEEVDSLLEMAPDIYGTLIYDDTHSLILVTYGNLTDSQKSEILAAAKDAVNFAGFPPGYNLIVTGSAALTEDMNIEMSASMGILLLLAIILMLVALLFVFKGVRWRLYPLAIVVIGIIYTFGFMGFAGINMTMVTISAFPILIGLGIDYAIQFHNRIEEELRECATRREAVVSTFKNMGLAVMTALAVTCVSFISLLTSSIPMIQDFGKLLIIGCLCCYMAALFFGVTSIYFLDKLSEKLDQKKQKTGKTYKIASFLVPKGYKSKRFTENENWKNGNERRENGKTKAGSEKTEHQEMPDNFITTALKKTVDFTLRYKNLIFIIAIITGILGVYADSTIPAETDFKKYIPQDMPALVDFTHMNTVMGGSDAINIMIVTEDIASPYVLKWVDEFGTYELENQIYVLGVDSLANVVKQHNGGVIPDTEEEIRAIYDQLPPETLERYTRGNSMMLLNLNMGNAFTALPMESVKSFVELIEEDIIWHQPPPGTSATITGQSVPFTELLTSLLSGRVEQTVLGLILVFLALLIIYRDFIKAVAPLITIALVIGWSGLIMYAFDIVYTPMTAVMGCMILGAGSEYSILLMERFYEERGKGHKAVEAMEKTVKNTGIALVVSGVTTTFGFLALTASAFGIVSSFGIVTVINMLMTLLASFVIFPPLMITFDEMKEKGFRATIVGFKNKITQRISHNKKQSGASQ
ncbi:RND family transporter [Methanolapillus ohkumae]|uniref:Protein translocase subunit SecD n=1 Tax=Methanolapillus ohkumae TaxID=3028298 RepID=A0AA96ZXJ1_9EURY|nr:Protein translocase subunit SecD [Methanosarcinaceae archaeon Am2]